MPLTLTGCILFLVCVGAGAAVVLPALQPLRARITTLKKQIGALPVDGATKNIARLQASLEGLEKLSRRGKRIFKRS